MTPEEHYAEAERLRALAIDCWTEPEGGYGPETPTDEERRIRAAVLDGAQKEAALYLAEAQVHATMALYRAPIRMVVHGEVPVPPTVLGWANLDAFPAAPQEEPGPEVTTAFDRDGDTWARTNVGWIFAQGTQPPARGDGLSWAELNDSYGPISTGDAS